jgi:hypothetical protein
MLTEKSKGNTRKGEKEAAIIPVDTRLQSGFSPNIKNKCCDLIISSKSNIIIRNAIVMAEQLFDNECKLLYLLSHIS